MNEAEAIKIIKRPDAQIYDLAPAAKFILGKYTALKETYVAAQIIRSNDKERIFKMKEAIKFALIGLQEIVKK